MNFTTKLIFNSLKWTVIGSLLIGLALYYLAADFYSIWFSGIFVFMAVVESLLIYWVEKLSHKVSDVGLVRVYMGISLGKMVVAVILIALYAKIVAIDARAFAIDFILLYLLFLIFESMAFVKLERYLKEKRLKK